MQIAIKKIEKLIEEASKEILDAREKAEKMGFHDYEKESMASLLKLKTHHEEDVKEAIMRKDPKDVIDHYKEDIDEIVEEINKRK